HRRAAVRVARIEIRARGDQPFEKAEIASRGGGMQPRVMRQLGRGGGNLGLRLPCHRESAGSRQQDCRGEEPCRESGHAPSLQWTSIISNRRGSMDRNLSRRLTVGDTTVIIGASDAMDVIASRIDTASESFRRNRQDMQALLAEVEAQLALARAGGGERSVARHRERGKLLIRERIELLLDRDAPFLELSPLAGWGTDFAVGGGFVSGLGIVSNVECVICGHDPTVLGGAITAISLKKINRALEISRLNRLPYIQFVESAGGDLRRGTEDPSAEMRRQLTHFAESGRLFHDITCLSADGIPTVSVVFGSSTTRGAYQPGMSDYTSFISDRSRVYLGGPPLVKMATGEDANDQDLGGGEMHATRSGLADYLADNEASAIRMARSVIAHLDWKKRGSGPT